MNINYQSPLVSIITPVLNGSKYLDGCIESVLNQSYPNIEHIFVDGGSTDGTVETITNYQAKYPDRIRFISEPDGGTGDAVNKGWRMAKGEIYGWLGSDDLLYPEAAQTIVDWFNLNPDAGFVFSRCNYLDKGGSVIGQSLKKDFSLAEAKQGINIIPFTSAFYRREVIEKVGWFNERGAGSDSAFWCRAGELYAIYRIDDVLSGFRVHPAALSAKTNKWGGHYAYYKFVLIMRLRPYLGWSYPFLKRLGFK